MAKRRRITCKDCYFRQAALCALTDGPCPTFRSAKKVGLEPPDQAQLVARAEVRAHAAA
jgi:predicted metal-binding transcription factor (methanogenesis marker protein 9)